MLKKLFEKDQKIRQLFVDSGYDPEIGKEIAELDAQHQAQVVGLLENGKVVTAEDKYYAAMIFHHGSTAKSSALAVVLSREAVEEAGDSVDTDTYTLFQKQAYDRWLLRQSKEQKYNTQEVKGS